MSLKMTCPNPACAKRYSIPEAGAGRSIRCKGCGETFIANQSATVNAAKADDLLEPAWAPAAPTAPPAPNATLSGNTVGRFVIRSKLGAGAFGTVYRAYDPQLDRVVALKVPNPGVMADAKRVERFLREAKATANLRHPHIVPVFDAGQDGDTYYIASAFIDGKPLSDTIDERGTDFSRAARIVRELAEALAYAHEQGIVHRDVKPANMMLDTHDRVHLMDFGLASRQDEEAKLTNDGAVMGTPAYMSPEQAKGQQGEAQPATDQYAAGVVLYELLTGRTPFGGPPAVVLANVIAMEPDPPRKHRAYIPRDLETICLKAMSKRPEQRYANCQELADDLRRWQEGEPITARRQGFGERAVRWVKKEPKLSAAAAMIALVLVVSVVFVTSAARRADEARQQAENNAAERDASRKREEQLVDEKFGAIGTTAQARIKLEMLDAEVTKARAEADPLRKQIAEAEKKVGTIQSQFADVLKKAEAFKTQLEEEQQNMLSLKKGRDDDRRKAEVTESQLALADIVAIRAAYLAFRAGIPEEVGFCLNIVRPESRGWEWRYILNVSNQPTARRVLKGPVGERLTTVSLNTDGTRVLMAARSASARVWDAKAGKELLILKLPNSDPTFETVAMSPDGSRVVVTGATNTDYQIWDTKTGKVLQKFKSGNSLDHYTPSFSRDGSMIVTTGGTDQMAGTLWHDNGKDSHSFSVNKGAPQAGSFSPDGKRFVTGGYNTIPRVWEFGYRAPYEVRKLQLPDGDATFCTASFSPDGKRIVTGGNGTPARVWDASTGKELLTLKVSYTNLGTASFNPDGSRIVTTGGNDDKTPRVWDINTGKELLALKGHTGVVWTAAFSPDGTRIATGGNDSSPRVWDAKTGKELLTLRCAATGARVSWSSDGSKLLIWLADGTVEILDGSPLPPAPKP